MTDLPDERKAIHNKWAFTIKRGFDGSVPRYKARQVVKGCWQKPSVDYEEMYSNRCGRIRSDALSHGVGGEV